ncbi:Protein kinase [Sorangium cellulosum So ce56]|uniref:Protein kinase n=1 Tax=Sorangium cellulosum (strain So ce56) TaxID=448385 RepID=A9G3D7_SORC5|nr:serine/threonine-protein kinase [Sorangium cellulosum]CAN95751.1 Protein kinase [Sorangium cellulosum So ce56]
MSATALAEGTVFARRYRVVRLIAAGAMGAVHEVVHLETERRRALKVMHPHLFQSEEMRRRFKAEACITAKIESEHIVDVFDAGIDEATGIPFLVMELLRGEELGERLKRAGRLPPAEVMTYLHQTALALDRTHAASIVHRDLKPANIFLSQREDGSVRVKILDFGVAKLVAEGATAAGATSSLGTPIYMPPEQFLGGTRLTGAADVFALGMMAYTLLVGLPYWHPEASSADGVFAFVMVAARGPEEPPVQRARAMGVALPAAFDAWFARATAGDPAARFQRATEAVRALGEVLGVPVAGGRGTFPSAPSWPGVVPAATALPSDLRTTEPAPGGTPVPPRDTRPSGPALVGSSTGVPVSRGPLKPASSRRGPLAAGLSALALTGVLGAGGWLALRNGPGSDPPTAPDGAAAAPATPEPPLQTPEPPPAPAAPTASADTAAAPTASADTAAAPTAAVDTAAAPVPVAVGTATAPAATSPPTVLPAAAASTPAERRPRASPPAPAATSRPAPAALKPSATSGKLPAPPPTSKPTSPYGRY